MATLKKLKSWFYPVTPLTIIAPLSIIVAIQSIFVGLTHESPMILYPIFVVPIAGFIFGLYVLDRFFIKSTPYFILFIVELVLVAGGYLCFKYINSTNDIHISTNNDYIFIIYDAQDNSLDTFTKTDIFSKELRTNHHVVHLNQSLCHNNSVRFFPPDNWNGSYQKTGKFYHQGDSIQYTYMSKHHTIKEQRHLEKHYIDSLLTIELQK